MNAVRTFLARTKRHPWLIVACLLCFAGAFGLYSWYQIRYVASGMQCDAPFNYYEVKHDGSVAMSRGVYHVYSHGGMTGKTSYIGKIFFADPQGQVTRTVAVNREIDWKMVMHERRIVSEITAINRRVGDHSDDALMQEFVFPSYKIGQVNNSGLFLLNGKVFSTGPENVPRVVCRE
ncbi:hypothetical protein [Pantoea sp.]|uniref:hypothetical protein n=1 Tax=Pantoea sp. TaxID=69393 RepID=UPI0031DBE05D